MPALNSNADLEAILESGQYPRPLHDYIVIVLDKARETFTEGGLVIRPESERAREERSMRYGRVLAVGPGMWAPFPTHEPMPIDVEEDIYFLKPTPMRFPMPGLTVGTRVAISQYEATEIVLRPGDPTAQVFHVIRATSILCTLPSES